MALNILAPVTDYQSMLNRIFWFTSASALAAVWLLRLCIPGLDALLSNVDHAFALGAKHDLATSGGYLLPALAVGMATRVFRLHARISDWLGIRESFDTGVIIREFADQLAIDVESIAPEPMQRARHRLMRNAFYPFVSGPRSQIDPQLIQQALDAWSWFWIGVEATLLFTLAGFALIASSVYGIGFQTLGASLAAATFGLPAIHAQCRRYAIAQVRAILADPIRAAKVRAAFADVIGVHGARRVAA